MEAGYHPVMTTQTRTAGPGTLPLQIIGALLLATPFALDLYEGTTGPHLDPGSPLVWMRIAAPAVALAAALVLWWTAARQHQRGVMNWSVTAVVLLVVRGVGLVMVDRSLNSIGAGLLVLAPGPLLVLCAVVILVLVLARSRRVGRTTDGASSTPQRPDQRGRSGSVTAPIACTARPVPSARE